MEGRGQESWLSTLMIGFGQNIQASDAWLTAFIAPKCA